MSRPGRKGTPCPTVRIDLGCRSFGVPLTVTLGYLRCRPPGTAGRRRCLLHVVVACRTALSKLLEHQRRSDCGPYPQRGETKTKKKTLATAVETRFATSETWLRTLYNIRYARR